MSDEDKTAKIDGADTVKTEGSKGSSKSASPTLVISSSTKGSYAPPQFTADTSAYQMYKRRLERWSRITKVEKKQQAEVVLYHLENHPSGIQEKIDTTIGDEIIDNEEGLDKLINYLDGIYGEDDMTEAFNSYQNFIRLKKTSNQTIAEFIAVFEGAYIKTKQSGCEFSDIVLAFNLLEAANLTANDQKFILTRVDFKEGKQKENLFDQFKSSLKLFQSRSGSTTSGDRIAVVDDLHLKDVLVAEGWTPPPESSRRKSGYKGKKNPLGRDGKPLKCFGCGSEYHMLGECDKKENVEERKPATTMLSTLLRERSKEIRTGREKEEAMITL